MPGGGRLVSVLAALAVIAPTVTPARAGEAAQDRPPFRSGVDIVEVDVTVTARRGRQPVTDLGVSDFRVRVDGRQRRVVQADLISPAPVTRRIPSSGPDLPPGPDVLHSSNAGLVRGGGRLVALVVDPESIPFGEGRQLLRTAGAFVDRLHPADRVALFEVPGPRVLIGPTGDQRRVGREVARMGGLGGPVGRLLCEPTDGRVALFEAFRIAIYGDMDALREAIERIFYFSGPRGQIACSALGMGDLVLAEARRIVQETRVRTRQAIRGVESVLRSLGEVEGHKTVVWIAGGLAIDTNMTLVRGIEEAAAASRVMLVTLMVPESNIDIEGGDQNPRPPRLRTQDRLFLEHGLSAAASVTGGEFYRALGNGRGLFERIEAQLAGRYRLAVEVSPRDRVERRRIDVRVARRGASARVRHAAAAERGARTGPAPVSVEARLAELLRSPVAESWLPLRVSTYAWPDGGGRARVAVTAQVGGSGFDGSDVTLAFALRDSWGAVVSSGRREMAGTVGNQGLDGAYEYTLPITAAPGSYALRVAAVDASGRGGSVEHPLRVGLALSDAPLALGALEVADAVDRRGDRTADGDPVVSSGQLAVSLDVRAESAWVFNRIRAQVEVARDESGPVLVRTEAPLRGPDATPWRTGAARLSVAGLDPGPYVARVRVLRGAEEMAAVQRTFRIAE